MEYFEILKNLFDNYVINKFHKLSALVVCLFISFWLLLSVHVVIKSDFNYEWYLYGAIFLIIIVAWLFFRYKWPYQKNKVDRKTGKKKTGLVIAISYKNYEGAKIRNKFINELQRNINDAGLNKYFNVISLLGHHSEKIKNNEDIEDLHKKVDGHIYFYGDVQKENDGKDIRKYFLNIDGYVKHLPIPIPVSQELAFDFRTVLPKEISFSEFFELRGCRATAKIVYLTTKYVVGAASFLSGNPFLAYEMHKNLVVELNEYQEIDKDDKIKDLTKFDFKQLKKIKNKLPLIISNETLVISRAYYLNEKYNEAQNFLGIALKNNPNNYGAYVLKAVYDFQLNNNPQESFESIKRAKKNAGNRFEWMYSYAFLKFWFDEYKDAYKVCKKITNLSYPWENITLEEVEYFNLTILEKDKSKPQLYFWIGYLNYRKKKNNPNALIYFEEFLKLADKNKMGDLIKKAETFLSEIKKEMSI
jgi:tetratricopeptide (TPR) repeat protein